MVAYWREFVGIANLNDESILQLYDNIRSQVKAERDLRHELMTGDSVKWRASALREEITRRRLQHTPIDWPHDQRPGTVAENGTNTIMMIASPRILNELGRNSCQQYEEIRNETVDGVARNGFSPPAAAFKNPFLF
jgi:hypothetical protein